MPRNIEIKAYARNFQQQRETASKLSTEPVKIIEQEDIFFKVPDGRLKLRKFNEKSGELIFYKRENSKSARKSEYSISKTDDPETLKEVLSQSNGILGVVRKTRALFMYGQTRIHMDVVEDLGEFIEFEFVLEPDDLEETGKDAVELLMEKFGILENDLIDVAYFDLIHGGNH